MHVSIIGSPIIAHSRDLLFMRFISYETDYESLSTFTGG